MGARAIFCCGAMRTCGFARDAAAAAVTAAAAAAFSGGAPNPPCGMPDAIKPGGNGVDMSGVYPAGRSTHIGRPHNSILLKSARAIVASWSSAKRTNANLAATHMTSEERRR